MNEDRPIWPQALAHSFGFKHCLDPCGHKLCSLSDSFPFAITTRCSVIHSGYSFEYQRGPQKFGQCDKW